MFGWPPLQKKTRGCSYLLCETKYCLWKDLVYSFTMMPTHLMSTEICLAQKLSHSIAL